MPCYEPALGAEPLDAILDVFDLRTRRHEAALIFAGVEHEVGKPRCGLQ